MAGKKQAAAGNKKIIKRLDVKKGLDLGTKNGRNNAIILALILIFLIITAYFNFFYTKRCKDRECFNSMLSKCKKAGFLSQEEDSTWFYAIKGASGGRCAVNVKNIWVKLNTAKDIEGKSMLCYMLKGVVASPESDLSECHGLLKEALQDIIIEKMHTYIVQNMGQISEDLQKPV